MFKRLTTFILLSTIVCIAYAKSGTLLFDLPNSVLNQPGQITLKTDQGKGYVQLQWNIPHGFHVYERSLNITAKDAKIGVINIPKAEYISSLGARAYTGNLNIRVPIRGLMGENSRLVVRYQGCNDAYCLLPVTKTIVLTSTVSTITINSPNWFGLLAFLGIGLLLAFTPCVLPMIPIITSIVIGTNHSKKKSILLAFSYISGMAISYASIGILISSIGLSFQLYFQQPLFIAIFSGIFVLLALTMFGVFQLQLPVGLSNKAHGLQAKLKGGSLIGSFLMGAIASLILSPCTSAPLIGVLGTILQTGSVIYGGLALLIMGFGMGIPLFLIAIGLNKLVPKSGVWMHEVKILFGFLMLGMSAFLLRRITPEFMSDLSYLLLVFSYIIYVILFSALNFKFGKWLRGWIISLATLSFIGLTSILFSNTAYCQSSSQQCHAPTTITNIHLESQIKKALNTHSQVLLDYFAIWCENCAALSKVLHSKPIEDYLKAHHIQLLSVNVSDYSKDNKALLNKAKILGLPTLRLLNTRNHEAFRVAGRITQPQLLAKLRQHHV